MLSGVVLYPTYTNKGNAIVPALVGGLGIALYTLFAPGRRPGRPVEASPGTEPAPVPVGSGAGHHHR